MFLCGYQPSLWQLHSSSPHSSDTSAPVSLLNTSLSLAEFKWFTVKFSAVESSLLWLGKLLVDLMKQQQNMIWINSLVSRHILMSVSKVSFFSDVSFNHFHYFSAPMISFISHSLLFTFQKCCYCNGKCIIMSGGGILQQYWDSIHCSTGCYNLATKDEIIWNVSIKLGCLALMFKNQRITMFMRTKNKKYL